MSEYLKPQSPLYHKTEDAYFYPLTTVDQVMLENGERLNSKLDKCVVVDTENVNIGEPNPVNADTLGGKQASEYATNDYVNQQVIKAAPRNLLDNSDFRNPVNQRGKTVYSNEYCIDRWKADNARSSFEIAENGVYFCNNGSTEGNTYLQQHLEDYKIVNGKYYTIAACIDGVIYSKSGVANGENTGVYIETPKGSIGFLYSPGYKVFAARYTTYSTTKTLLEWMALYEGEYTAETLPEYQPKGYGVELKECMQYFQTLFVGSCKVSTATSGGTYQDNFPHPKLRLKATVAYNPLYNYMDNVTSISVSEKFNGLTAVVIKVNAATYEYLGEVTLSADL